MAYASASDVAAFCSNLITGAANFSDSTTPNITQVNAWLSSGCAIMEGYLTSVGYTPPPGTNTAAYIELRQLNAFYGAAMAEMARTNIRLTPGERTRGQQFEKMFWDGLDRLLKRDLSAVGMTYSHRGYIGGVSESDVETVKDDTDRVPTRFNRGVFDLPGTTRPQFSADDEEER